MSWKRWDVQEGVCTLEAPTVVGHSRVRDCYAGVLSVGWDSHSFVLGVEGGLR